MNNISKDSKQNQDYRGYSREFEFSSSKEYAPKI